MTDVNMQVKLRPTKQVIIVNNSLRSKLRHGKLAAQVAHASMGALLKSKQFTIGPNGERTLHVDLNEHSNNWLLGSFTKVVLRADDEGHMNMLYGMALDANIPSCWIRDAGRTVFENPTSTCIGIGPWCSMELDELFGCLKMY